MNRSKPELDHLRLNRRTLLGACWARRAGVGSLPLPGLAQDAESAGMSPTGTTSPAIRRCRASNRLRRVFEDGVSRDHRHLREHSQRRLT